MVSDQGAWRQAPAGILRIVIDYLRTSKSILLRHIERVRDMPRRT